MSLSPFFWRSDTNREKSIVKVSPGNFFVLALDVKIVRWAMDGWNLARSYVV